jgi:hypothetical protein
MAALQPFLSSELPGTGSELEERNLHIAAGGTATVKSD